MSTHVLADPALHGPCCAVGERLGQFEWDPATPGELESDDPDAHRPEDSSRVHPPGQSLLTRPSTAPAGGARRTDR